MRTIKLFLIIFSCFFALISQNVSYAANHKILDVVMDSSDKIIYFKGQGDFTKNNDTSYIPVPYQNDSQNLINDITTFTISAPLRYVVDIPNSILVGEKRTYELKNSNVIKSITLSQFSTTPSVVRAVFTLNNSIDASKFKTYTNNKDIVVKYNGNIIDNSIQYKFYTPNGDMDKNTKPQNTYYSLIRNLEDPAIDAVPRIQTKYYLSQISQNSDGLILRGLGSISLQRAKYSDDNTKATLIIDNATLSEKFNNKTYDVPSSDKNIETTLTISRINPMKIKLVLEGAALRDYRFVVSPDGQSLFISHRTYVINTVFSSNVANSATYKVSKNANNYSIFEFNFNQQVAYNAFEQNNNFYLDIVNLSDFNEIAFQEMLKNTDIAIKAQKISGDKTRYTIPMENLNFSYANVESNAKSIKLCFKDKPAPPPVVDVQIATEVVIAPTNQNEKEEFKTGEIKVVDNKKDNLLNVNDKNKQEFENINVTYIPKNENDRAEKPKKKKQDLTLSSVRRVVIDAGHGGADSGAIGDGHFEKTINLNVAKIVEEKLTKKDIHVYMTRKKDETLTLEERVNLSNEISPDIFVSIHTNSTLQGDSFGLETHYFKDDSLDLANTIHSIFASPKNLDKWETKDRGVIKSRFYVINHTEAPSVLIEIGFLSNEFERAKLLKKNRQEEIAEAIVKGILEYLKVKWFQQKSVF